MLAIFGNEGLHPQQKNIWHEVFRHCDSEAWLITDGFSSHKATIRENRIAVISEILQGFGIQIQPIGLIEVHADSNIALLFAGGKADILAQRSNRMSRLIELHYRKRLPIITVGSTSPMFGHTMLTPVDGRANPIEYTRKPGLSMLENAITLPYFDQLDSEVKSRLTALRIDPEMIIGLDSSAALIIDKKSWKIRGSGGVTVISPDKTLIFEPNQEYEAPIGVSL